MKHLPITGNMELIALDDPYFDSYTTESAPPPKPSPIKGEGFSSDVAEHVWMPLALAGRREEAYRRVQWGGTN
jgi:hypothetical protein